MGFSSSACQWGIYWQRWSACSYSSLLWKVNLPWLTLLLTYFSYGSWWAFLIFFSAYTREVLSSGMIPASIFCWSLTNMGVFSDLMDLYYLSIPSDFLNVISPRANDSDIRASSSWVSYCALIFPGTILGTCSANSLSLTVRNKRIQ